MSNRIGIFLFGATLSLLGATAMGADWPQWRGPARDAISRETGLLKNWPAAGPKVLWEAPLGAGASAVAVAAGRVFTMYQDKTQQYAAALDEKTGKELWRHGMGASYANVATGPRSTPTVDGGRVYFLDALGNLACLQAVDGKEVWKINILDAAGAKPIPWRVANSPFISGDMLVVNSGVDAAHPQCASVMALDKNNGKILWKSLNDVAGYSTPVQMKVGGVDQFVLLTGQSAVGLAARDGKLLWRYPWPNKTKINVPTPVIVAEDKVFFTTGYGIGCVMLQIVPQGGAFQAREVWPMSKAMQCRYGNPIFYEGYLYGFNDKTLTCIDPQTGQATWTQKGFGYGALSVAEGLFYIIGEKGNLALARLTPQKFEKISEFPIFAGQKEALWTVPTVANGQLYVRNKDKLVCLDVKAQ